VAGCLAVHGGYVVLVDGGAQGDVVCWWKPGWEKTQELTVPSPWTNALLMAGGRLWLGCGYSSGDPLTRDTGVIAQYSLEADGWSLVRKEGFEQAVLAMSLQSDGTVLVVCDTIVYSCDGQFRKTAVYGNVGLVDPSAASWYGADTVNVCRVRESIFIGTPLGIVALVALDGQARGLYREVFMVPPGMVVQAVSTGGLGAECVVDFE